MGRQTRASVSDLWLHSCRGRLGTAPISSAADRTPMMGEQPHHSAFSVMEPAVSLIGQQEEHHDGTVHTCAADGARHPHVYPGMQRCRCRSDCRVLLSGGGPLFSRTLRQMLRGSYHREPFCDTGPGIWDVLDG